MSKKEWYADMSEKWWYAEKKDDTSEKGWYVGERMTRLRKNTHRREKDAPREKLRIVGRKTRQIKSDMPGK